MLIAQRLSRTKKRSMSQCDNLIFANSLAQSMGLTEYEVVYYAPSATVLAKTNPSAAVVEWEETAKSSDERPSLLLHSNPIHPGSGAGRSTSFGGLKQWTSSTYQHSRGCTVRSWGSGGQCGYTSKWWNSSTIRRWVSPTLYQWFASHWVLFIDAPLALWHHLGRVLGAPSSWYYGLYSWSIVTTTVIRACSPEFWHFTTRGDTYSPVPASGWWVWTIPSRA